MKVEQMGMIRAIAEAREQKEKAEIVVDEDMSEDKIVYGAKVTLMNLDTNQKEIYKLVGSAEIDGQQRGCGRGKCADWYRKI